MTVGEIQEHPETSLGQDAVVLTGSQVFPRTVQFDTIHVGCLVGETSKAFQPKFAAGCDLVALFREYDGKESLQFGLAPYLDRDSQQQVSLAAATRTDDDHVRIRVSGTLAQSLDD